MPEYYFAYGSDLARSQMEKRAPGHAVYGLAHLPEHILTFQGQSRHSQANAEPTANQRVFGLIYELKTEDLPPLDDFHHPDYLRCKKEVFITGLQTHYPVWLYLPQKMTSEHPPLHQVYRLLQAAQIIPGYPPQDLARIKSYLTTLKPQYLDQID